MGTLSTSFVSTRCFHVLELIVSRLACVVLSAKPMALSHVSRLGRFCAPSVAVRPSPSTPGGSPSCQVQDRWSSKDLRLSHVGSYKVLKEDFMEGRRAGRILHDGVGILFENGHGKLKRWIDRQHGIGIQ